MKYIRGLFGIERVFYVLFAIVVLNSFSYSQSQKSNSEKSKSDESLIDSLLQSCWDKRSNSPREALADAYKAIKLIESKDIDEKKTTALNFIGVIYRNLGKLDSAYYFYKSAYIISVARKDQKQTAYSLTNLGEYYYKNALYSTALEKLLRAYKIFEQLKDERGLAYTLNYIGEIYLETKDISKANEYLKRAAELRKKNGDNRGYAKSLLNIVDISLLTESYDEAIEQTKLALRISQKIDYKKGISEAYSKMSDIYFHQGLIDSSFHYGKEALKIDIQTENKYSEIKDYISLGFICLKTGNSKEAKKYLWKAEEEARNTKHFSLLLTTFRYLADLSVFEKNYKAAYLYQKKFDELNDKLFGEETRTKIADLQTAFAIERKERENEKLAQQIQHEKIIKNYLIISFFLLSIAVFAFVLRFRSERKNRLLLAELNESKDKFFRIIGHDLKNPFSAILSYTQMLESEFDELTNDEKKEIIANIRNASERIQILLNDLLTWATSNKGEIVLNKTQIDLNEFLNHVIQSFESLTKQKDIKILIENSDVKFVYADKFILQTILNNFINNAIKFSNPGSKIIIRIEKNGNNISFSIIDFGVGIEKQVLENLFKVDSKITTPGTMNELGTGLGLKICNELASAHNGKISVLSEVNQGSTFTFTIPL